MCTPKKLLIIIATCLMASCSNSTKPHQSISGIYPHLAYYNNEGECGTGAVVCWGGKLWVITYAPHAPFGSSDKLYEIDKDLNITTRSESVGGTPANRLIHKESNQLFIGSYAISEDGEVRAIPLSVMQGRMTGSARHLTQPQSKVYTATMEEGFYEIDVNTLEVNTLFADNNQKTANGFRVNGGPQLLDGAHGKGLYSGQGVLVYSNNGDSSQQALTDFDAESGILAEWDGKEWQTVRRNQFVEITGPGGINGNANPESDPIWATGWDNKSILVGVRTPNKGWSFYRLPKASNSYDGAHGWNTEWPRIRDVGTDKKPRYMMTMHGMFWDFPANFTVADSKGIRPRTSYLKIIGDFTRWNDRLVFGCDDTAQKEFLNVRKIKGEIAGPGQSNSNLWFTSLDTPDQLGRPNASGAVWLNDAVTAGSYSEPFLFDGWDNRALWINNDGGSDVELRIEVDKKGDGSWSEIKRVSVPAKGGSHVIFTDTERGEWVRLVSNKSAKLTAVFQYTSKETRGVDSDAMFAGITPITSKQRQGGLLSSLGGDSRKLGVLAGSFNGGSFSESGYYELDSNLNLIRVENADNQNFIREKMAISMENVFIEAGSVLIVDDKGRRWRLPLGKAEFKDEINSGNMRVCREVVTERDLLNMAGTFYELPAENADGFAKLRPISSHNLNIHDYGSWRGMLVLTGIDPKSAKNSHIIRSEDNQAAVWCGVIDDLWKLGKPTGEGGPWVDSQTAKGVASDPYLIGFYDNRKLSLKHNSSGVVRFTMEVNPMGHGPWIEYKSIAVGAGETVDYTFPDGFDARWIRFKTDKPTVATAYLKYM